MEDNLMTLKEPLYTDTISQEVDRDNQNEELNDPFNPEEISISSKIIAMETCLRRLIEGTIKLNPDFQRNEVWDDDKKSQLIESLMLKIPLPMFYVSADDKNNYTVVDGLQRLSTIRSFILGDEYLKTKDENKRGNGFRLKTLEFWKDYEKKNFNDLPSNIRGRILESEFTFTIINPGTPEEVRRNIFKRLNTGGEPLSSQEIRNALYIGESTVLLKELSNSNELISATGPIKNKRMEDRELILRFLAFYIRDYTTYKRTISADTFLSDTMIIINSMPKLESKEFKKFLEKEKEKININDIIIRDLDIIKESFKKGMNRSHALFGNHAFRISYGDHRKNRINKSLFETWGVLLSRLSNNEFDLLLSRKELLIGDYIPYLTDYTFQLTLSRDSMKHTAVKSRFDTIKELITKHII